MLISRVYIDTSVIGGCFDDEFSEYSNLLFEEFLMNRKVAIISNLTLKELQYAPEKIRKRLEDISKEQVEYVGINQESEELAKKYIESKVISPKFEADAQHIAIATVERADVLVSWNFKHIVNLQRIRGYNSVNIIEGYQFIEIRTPREVINEK